MPARQSRVSGVFAYLNKWEEAEIESVPGWSENVGIGKLAFATECRSLAESEGTPPTHNRRWRARPWLWVLLLVVLALTLGFYAPRRLGIGSQSIYLNIRLSDWRFGSSETREVFNHPACRVLDWFSEDDQKSVILLRAALRKLCAEDCLVHSPDGDALNMDLRIRSSVAVCPPSCCHS